MSQISLAEPACVTAGDTLTWVKSLSDYPAAGGWVLKYRLINAANRYDIVSVASGEDHSVSVSATVTAGYAAGVYSVQGYVEGAVDQRFTVYQGQLVVLANLAAQVAGYDTRSPAKQALDALNAALGQYGNKAYVSEYQIAGRVMKFRSPGEFLAMRDKLMAEVAREQAVLNMSAGGSARRKVFVRFG
jgi:hypothetical protein